MLHLAVFLEVDALLQPVIQCQNMCCSFEWKQNIKYYTNNGSYIGWDKAKSNMTHLSPMLLSGLFMVSFLTKILSQTEIICLTCINVAFSESRHYELIAGLC
jgi:hypothetical protein